MDAGIEGGDGGGGVFVVLEGIDGAGTTTQAQRLAAHLRGRRQDGPRDPRALLRPHRCADPAGAHAAHIAPRDPAGGGDGAAVRGRPARPRGLGDRAVPARRLRRHLGQVRPVEPGVPVDQRRRPRVPVRRERALAAAGRPDRVDPRAEPLRPPSGRHRGARRLPQRGRRAPPGEGRRGRAVRRRRAAGPARARLPAGRGSGPGRPRRPRRRRRRPGGRRARHRRSAGADRVRFRHRAASRLG